MLTQCAKCHLPILENGCCCNSTPSSDERVEQRVNELAGLWWGRWKLDPQQSRTYEAIFINCARFHIAAVAEKDVELANLKTSTGHDIFNLKRRLEESQQQRVLLEQESKCWQKAHDLLCTEFAKAIADVSTIRTALRAVCEAGHDAVIAGDGLPPLCRAELISKILDARPLLEEQPVGKGGV